MNLTRMKHAASNQGTNLMQMLRKIMGISVLMVGVSATAMAADFTGPWEIATEVKALKTVDGKAPALTAEGKRLQQENLKKGDPMDNCLPPGIPRTMLQKDFAINFVVGKDVAGMFFEWNHLPRPIWIGNEHFENIGLTYFGQSVAKWEGDTLVVDTNGFNDLTWLDDSGLPHSEDLHLVERIRLKDANTLENRITVTDPKIYTSPWTTVLTFKKRPGYIVKEDWCIGRTQSASKTK